MPGSSTRRILTSDIMATPWKNGGGVTREIATGGSMHPNQAWGWRVSLAEVAQDGPFSIFPETDRMIAEIDGGGMDLVSPEGATIALEPFQAVRRSEEHTSDLQSLMRIPYDVLCLKKKNTNLTVPTNNTLLYS